MFWSTGLGVHILPIIEKLQSHIIYIEEDDIEIFYLSLFVTDYSTLMNKRTIVFCISEEVEQKRTIFFSFLNLHNEYNLYIKYIPFYSEYFEKLKVYQQFSLQQPHIAYSYSAKLLRCIDGPRYIVQNKFFLNISHKQNLDIFQKYPVLFLFSGPSTHKNITWIKANYKKFIIVCALSTCKLLYHHNITPDIIIHIDPDGPLSLKLFEGIEESFFKKSVFIFSSNIHPDIVLKTKAYPTFFIQQGEDYCIFHFILPPVSLPAFHFFESQTSI